jgi:hypothetical protein
MNDEHRDGSPLREALYTATHKKYSDEHRCSKTLAKPECAQEVNDLEDIVARRERDAVRAALESLPVTKLSPLGMRHDERYLVVFKREIDIAVEQLNRPEGRIEYKSIYKPGDALPYWKSKGE